MKTNDTSRNFEQWLSHHENPPQSNEEWAVFKNELLKHWHSLELKNYQLKEQTLTDSLTGALMLPHFEKELERRLCSFQKHAIIMIDMDNFKSINRDHGHLAGNQALRQISQFLRIELPMTNIFSRFGGDEFVISFPVQQTSEIKAFCQILLAKVSNSTYNLNGQRRKLSFTLGATISHQFDTSVSAIQRADTALLKAKKTRKGSYCFVDNNQSKQHYSNI